MEDPRISWLILLNTPATGPVQHRKLLDIYSSPENILSASHSELAGYGLKKEAVAHLKSISSDKYIESAIDWLNEENNYLVTIDDCRYPLLLKEISDAPVALFVKGNPDVLNSHQIGIVGSRNPTAGGRKTAKLLAAQLAEIGLTITSGLALGIDYCSHEGALEVNGNTIAVLGNGPDKIYPARHTQIAGAISGQGAIISEFFPGTPPIPVNFPRRNRIISGLSLGVIVVEAALKSGSLITARYALEQGREVFAVPGSIYSPLSKGCHHLIKQGARLVETTLDILDELNLQLTSTGSDLYPSPPGENASELNAEHRKILEYLSYDPVTVDKLIELSGLTADAVSSMLLVLEVQGIVSSSGGLYTRIN